MYGGPVGRPRRVGWATIVLIAPLVVVFDPVGTVTACSCATIPSPAEYVRRPEVTTFIGVADDAQVQNDGSTIYHVTVNQSLIGPGTASVEVVGEGDSGSGALCGGSAVTLPLGVELGFMIGSRDAAGRLLIPSGLCVPIQVTEHRNGLRLLVSRRLPMPDGEGEPRGLTRIDDTGAVALLDGRGRTLGYVGGMPDGAVTVCPGSRTMIISRPEVTAGGIATVMYTLDVATLEVSPLSSPSGLPDARYYVTCTSADHDLLVFPEQPELGSDYYTVDAGAVTPHQVPAGVRPTATSVGSGWLLWISESTEPFIAPVGILELVPLGRALLAIDGSTIVATGPDDASIVRVALPGGERTTIPLTPPEPGLALGSLRDGTERFGFHSPDYSTRYVVDLSGAVSPYVAPIPGRLDYGDGWIGYDASSASFVFDDGATTPILPWFVGAFSSQPPVLPIPPGGSVDALACTLDDAAGSLFACPIIELPSVL
jgi:hypothetical protein